MSNDDIVVPNRSLPDANVPDPSVNLARRDALASIAKFSAYTAPALLLTVSAPQR